MSSRALLALGAVLYPAWYFVACAAGRADVELPAERVGTGIVLAALLALTAVPRFRRHHVNLTYAGAWILVLHTFRMLAASAFDPMYVVGTYVALAGAAAVFLEVLPLLAFSGWVVLLAVASCFASAGSFAVAEVAGVVVVQLMVIVAATRHIAARKDAEAAVRASEERFRAAAEGTLDAFIILEAVRDHAGSIVDFRYVFLNAPAMVLLRASEATIGQHVLEIYPQMRANGSFAKYIAATNGSPVDEEVFLEVPGLWSKWLRRRMQKLGDGVAITNEDVTSRKEADDRLRMSEEQTRRSFDGASLGMALTSADGRYVRVNPRLCEMLGYAEAELLGKSFREFSFPEDANADGEVVRRMLEREVDAVEREKRYVRKDGDTLFARTSVALVRDASGAPLNFVVQILDISAQKRAEIVMRRALADAEKSARVKAEFLANMSHEIRTPMNGILGMTELALDTKLDAEQREYLRIVHDSASALLRLLNDILDFSKMEAGKMTLDAAPFSLREIADSTLGLLGVRAAQKGLALIGDIDETVVDRVTGDSGRFRQILGNLVGNAIKFTESGSIRFALREETRGDDHVVLHGSVHDTGIGIPAKKQELVFEAFAQADGSTTRKYGGTGLGLTITRNIVEQMGGKIWLESTPGAGTTFHFTLRLGVEASAETNRPALAPAAIGPLLQPTRRKQRVLVVEDNDVNKMLVVRLLEKRGHEIVTASDGEEAVRRATRETFDVVLMDIQMPRLGGLEATAQIRAHEAAERSPRNRIVALTAHAMKGDAERFVAAGMDGHLSKPLSTQALYRVVEQEPAGAAFDAPALAERFRGDADVLREVVEVFVHDYPAQYERLLRAVEATDGPAIEQAAHSLKGAVSIFGAEDLVSIASMLEDRGRARDLVALVPIAQRLGTGLQALDYGLQAFMKETTT